MYLAFSVALPLVYSKFSLLRLRKSLFTKLNVYKKQRIMKASRMRVRYLSLF